MTCRAWWVIVYCHVSRDTESPLHRNLQVVTFQRCERVLACPVMEVGSHLTCIVTRVHPLQVAVPHGTVLYGVEQYSIFI